ncbi:hypothetical protein F511_23110 [Dorcoceras hygrometricum]|uniref:Uncharacterized protein n=1 Tax=Dorcoceras hygrometricum TaxID=472368 RepID=A0A2Z7D8W6_9LAMI|nr:hypothetical protein F511_23110 [Dorcoceras hygrometricum]
MDCVKTQEKKTGSVKQIPSGQTATFWSNRFVLVKQLCLGQTALPLAANRFVICCQQLCHLLRQLCHLLSTDLSLAANRFRHWLPTDFVTGQTNFCTVNSAANSAVNSAVNPVVNSSLTT